MTKRRRPAREGGYTLFIVAASLLLLLGVSAIAIDLSALRLDRAVDQKVADMAASAGALAVYEGDGRQGCETALAYVQLNAPQVGTLDDSGCVSIPTTCSSGDLATTVSQDSGRFTIAVVHPVPDDHPLMTSSALGAPAQVLTADDGSPCERIGVEVSAEHEAHIAQVIGFERGTTRVHAVARAFMPPPDGPPINLLLLDRFGCGVLTASGGGSPPPGGVIVDAVYDQDTGTLVPGIAAVDSDGSNYGSPCDEDGTIDVNGANAVVRADGPECPDQLGTELHSSGLIKGLGCGLVQTVAPGTPGCDGPANLPACSGSGSNKPVPDPTDQGMRYTRAPVDHRYNCRADYSTIPVEIQWATSALTSSNEQDIAGCANPPNPAIHQLIRDVDETGMPPVGMWSQWSTVYPCDIPSSHASIHVTGNWWVDCSDFLVRTEVRVTGGSMVFDGNVSVTSNSGHLHMSNAGNPGFAFLRNGLFSKDGQASITLVETMVYASKSSRLAMNGGGDGTLTWIAPDDENHNFDDLALWSDSEITDPTLPHFWEGQAALEMEGVFFVPIVTVEYAGKGEQQHTKAQFIADKVHARGNGALVIAPVSYRAVDLRSVPQTMLLR